MDWPEEQQAEQLRKNAAKQARQNALAHARKQLEKNSEYPSVVVQINDADQEIRKSRTQDAGLLRSEARLEYLLRVVDAHGKAYLRLAVDLDSVKALETIMSDLAREMWYQFSGLQPEEIPPIEPSVTPQLAQLQRAMIFDQAHHWTVEGYRRLAALHESAQQPATSSGREHLRDSYFATFQEKVSILDVCWAARQHYREWKRWISGGLKDGSKSDRAFRAILGSGKKPEDYRKEPRPPKWQ